MGRRRSNKLGKAYVRLFCFAGIGVKQSKDQKNSHEHEVRARNIYPGEYVGGPIGASSSFHNDSEVPLYSQIHYNTHNKGDSKPIVCVSKIHLDDIPIHLEPFNSIVAYCCLYLLLSTISILFIGSWMYLIGVLITP